ncbi:MAG: acetyl-CoA carboxylase biotin carboxyl carrier protein subunit [Acidobacteriota bacterium]|nr:acetyl-CoA carboxylase biotin carboxyl carrier protein subunit [Acidobacteriota bacterium]
MTIDRVEPAGPNQVMVSADGRRYLATVVWDGSRAWVHVAGAVHVIEPREAAGRRSAATPDHDALSAPMPATVTRLHVSAGDVVKSGDVVALLEAMKMELPVRAPRDGVVARVNCAAGQLVQPGVPLIDLE